MGAQHQYDLHLLGWQNFQQLCNTILREIFGQTVQSFLYTNDGGRDGAFSGEWTRTGQETLTGKFVVQCKHTSKQGSTLSLSHLTDELEKAERLVKAGRCDCYLLLTNAGVTADAEEKIVEAFKNCGVKDVLVLSYTWICDQIHFHKKIRTSLPRLYGLGDLSEILDERSYKQAQQILSSMKDELAKLVLTGSYKKASLAMEKYGFVLLVGDPASGKTTVATQLIMAALDNSQALMMKLDTSEEVKSRWNPDSKSQLFWIDDAFGATQYEVSRALGWNYIFPEVKAMLSNGGKIIMTSRNYIYARAKKDLKESAFPLMQEANVVINIHDLTKDEKQQILYNHLKLGKQPKLFLTEIKPYLELIALHKNFSPETARRLADPIFTKKLALSADHLTQFIEKQESFLQDVIKGLNKDDQAALALIYMRNDRLESPINLKSLERDALAKLGSAESGCIDALRALNGSLVHQVEEEDVIFWKFKHPTISDAYSEILVENTELLDVYLRGTSVDKVMRRVTCGNVGLQGAVIVPKSYFEIILDRLDSFTHVIGYSSHYGSYRARQDKERFISRRCSKEFIEMYLTRHQNFMDDILRPEPPLFLSARLDIALKLKQFGHLTEAQRLKIMEAISEYAVKGEDMYALDNKDALEILNEDELVQLKDSIRNELIPNLGNLSEQLEDNFDRTLSPDAYMDEFRGVIKSLRRSFDSDEVQQHLDMQEVRLDKWIEENGFEEPEISKAEVPDFDTPEDYNTSRSVFDDVDA